MSRDEVSDFMGVVELVDTEGAELSFFIADQCQSLPKE